VVVVVGGLVPAEEFVPAADLGLAADSGLVGDLVSPADSAGMH
jgi:hypothetical protein